jgi:hypothetical protein
MATLQDMGRRWLAYGIAGSALLLAGCSGGGGSTSGSGASSGSGDSGPSAAAVCAKVPTKPVARIVKEAGARAPALRRAAGGTAQLVKCSFMASGVHVDFNLDLAANSQQRFDNRVVEMTQFSNARPATRPRPVPGVGDAKSGNEGAQWIPALDQLLAFRPGRYLIVDFSVEGASDDANRAGAAALARLAFPVLPGAKGAGRERPSPGG